MPCLHLARLLRVGLVGPLVRDNAEWSSALLGHAGIENRICRIIRLRGSGGSGRGGIDPEDPDSSTFFRHHPILLIFFIKVSVLREGVCRETRGGHTPPAPHSWDEVLGTPLHQGKSEDEGCLQPQCTNRYGRRHRRTQANRKIKTETRIWLPQGNCRHEGSDSADQGVSMRTDRKDKLK